MNNKNKILIGCLALLLVMSIGYALFSDTITISGTATAKGEFKLETTCDMDVNAIDKAFNLASIHAEKGSVEEANITCSKNKVDASAILGYPGSEKTFRIMVKNTGTIPARLKKVVELNNPDYYIIEEGNSNIFIENNVSSGKNYLSSQLLPGLSWMEDYATIDGTGDVSWSEDQLYAVLDPEETAFFYINMRWSSNSTEQGEPLTATLNVEMDWEQVTVE